MYQRFLIREPIREPIRVPIRVPIREPPDPPSLEQNRHFRNRGGLAVVLG